jgi:hypothetical protein
MDQHNPNAAKHFRPDTASIRPKQSTPMMQNRRTSAKMKTRIQSFCRHLHERRENFEETMTHITTDTKQVYDIDLSMNCSEEQLSEDQIPHHAVKVSVTLVGEHRSSVCICLDTRPIGQHQVFATEDLAIESNEKEDYVPRSLSSSSSRENRSKMNFFLEKQQSLLTSQAN